MKHLAALSLSLKLLCVLGRAIVLSAAMGALTAVAGCASESSAPSRSQIANFSEQLNVGAYIFTVVRDTNGSQSVVYVPTIFRVVRIDGDFVHAAWVQAVQRVVGSDQITYGMVIPRGEYERLKATIHQKLVAETESDLFPTQSELRTAFRVAPNATYFFSQSPRAQRVFSKRAILAEGALVPYYGKAGQALTDKSERYGAATSYVEFLAGANKQREIVTRVNSNDQRKIPHQRKDHQ